MAMSKKDFIALADQIRSYNEYAKLGHRARFDANHLQLLADFCKTQNPNFMPYRWNAYINGECGPSGGALKKTA